MTKKSKTVSSLIASAMAIIVALTLIGSAFASNAQTYNNDESSVSLAIYPTLYFADVAAPAEATKTSLSVTLYQKQLFTWKEVDSASKSVNTNYCSISKNYDFQTNKTYKLEVVAKVYCDGQWDTIEKSIKK